MRIESFRRACVARCECEPRLARHAGARRGQRRRHGRRDRGEPDANARAVVDATLARADVRAKLAEMGVEPAAIEGRLAALSDRTRSRRSPTRSQSAPAGGDALAVIGIVFVVLIILELVGVIDIFKKT